MQRATILLAGLAVLLLGTTIAFARSSPKAPCKKIKDAVMAGHTMDELMKEFDTDAATVMKCTQKQGKRRASPKEKKTKAAKPATKSHQRSPSSTGQSEPSPPRQNRQPNLRLAPAPVR